MIKTAYQMGVQIALEEAGLLKQAYSATERALVGALLGGLGGGLGSELSGSEHKPLWAAGGAGLGALAGLGGPQVMRYLRGIRTGFRTGYADGKRFGFKKSPAEAMETVERTPGIRHGKPVSEKAISASPKPPVKMTSESFDLGPTGKTKEFVIDAAKQYGVPYKVQGNTFTVSLPESSTVESDNFVRKVWGR